MNYQQTVKNWKWWVILPIAVLLLLVSCIPRVIIFSLGLIISIVELVNFGDKNYSVGAKILKWVHEK